jgi:hypothetical protein
MGSTRPEGFIRIMHELGVSGGKYLHFGIWGFEFRVEATLNRVSTPQIKKHKLFNDHEHTRFL